MYLVFPSEHNWSQSPLTQYHNIKDNEGNIRQDLLTIENTDSDLKVHALNYANDCLNASDFPFKNNKKKCLGKE